MKIKSEEMEESERWRADGRTTILILRGLT